MTCLKLTSHSSGSLLIVLLLTSALFVSIYSVATPPEKVYAAGLTFLLSSSSGKYGDVITFKTTALAGTAPNGTSCSSTGAPTNVVTNFHGQEYNHNATGWFVVGTGPSGVGGAAYTITITCGADSGTATFTVSRSMTISPPISEASKIVTVAAYGLPSNTVGPCTITDNGTIPVVLGSPAPCTIVALSGSATGTFTVDPLATHNGNYTIFVNYSGGSFPSADAAFRKVAADTPTGWGPLLMSPHSAPPKWGPVSITGGGFHKTGAVRNCAVSPQAGLVDLVDVVSETCTIDANGILTAGFAVGSSALPTHTGLIQIVDATTPGGPFSAGTFTVNATAAAITTIKYDNRPAGTFVSLGATKLSQLDAGACIISSFPTVLISSYFCVIDSSGNILNATFVVSRMLQIREHTP